MPSKIACSCSCTVEYFDPSSKARVGKAKSLSSAIVSLKPVKRQQLARLLGTEHPTARVAICQHEESSPFQCILRIKDPKVKDSKDGAPARSFLQVLLCRSFFSVYSNFAPEGKLTLRVPKIGVQIMLSNTPAEWCCGALRLLAPMHLKRLVAKLRQRTSRQKAPPPAAPQKMRPNGIHAPRRKYTVPRRFRNRGASKSFESNSTGNISSTINHKACATKNKSSVIVDGKLIAAAPVEMKPGRSKKSWSALSPSQGENRLDNLFDSPVIVQRNKSFRKGAPLKSTRVLNLYQSSSSSADFDSVCKSAIGKSVQGDISLNYEQMEALQLLKSGRNLFITGPGGSGKSVLISACVEWAKKCGKRVHVTGTTGVAACNIGGVTLHSWSGLNTREVIAATASKFSAAKANQVVRRMRKSAVDIWHRTDLLFIDEISMLERSHLDVLDQIGQAIRQSPLPFGGIQLVLVGDFLQLPPVKSRCPPTSSASGIVRPSSFAFNSACFERLFGISRVLKGRIAGDEQDSVACVEAHVDDNTPPLGSVVMLRTVHRQGKDEQLVSLLNRARFGRVTKEDISILHNKCYKSSEVSDHCPENAIHVGWTYLCTHVSEARSRNTAELAKLPGLHHTFNAVDWQVSDAAGRALSNICRAPAKLELSIGAQVILVKTLDAASGLVNGARGVVSQFTPKTCQPVVLFDCGEERIIGPERWNIRGGRRSLQEIASRKQLPLDLAWAISIHKSQGMTLDRAVVSLSNVFECGQGYVALSRVRSLDGLRIRGSVSER